MCNIIYTYRTNYIGIIPQKGRKKMEKRYVIEHDNGKVGQVGFSDGYTEEEMREFVETAKERGIMIFSVSTYTE